MEINKPVTTRNSLSETLMEYRTVSRPVRMPKVTIELDKELRTRFKIEAERRGVTMRDMLIAWIERDCPPLNH